MVLKESGKFFLYWGNSMGRVFRPGDELHYETVDFSELNCGDIVVFHSADRRQQVVHRLIRIYGKRGITMGEANPRPDRSVLKEEVLVGRVTGFRRGAHCYPVRNGSAGRWLFRCNRGLLGLENGMAFLFRPLCSSKLDCLRIPLQHQGVFSGSVHYGRCGRVIAEEQDGQIRFRRRLFRLIFTVRPKRDGV